MKTIELFAGTCSFSKVAKQLGFQTFTTDYEEIDGQDLVADIATLTAKDFPYQPDILWASPPCEGFSVASIGANWGGGEVAVHTQERHRMPFNQFSESRTAHHCHLRAKVVVHRESTGCVEKSSFASGSAFYAYHLVLQIWGYKSKTNEYLDERTVVQATACVQELPVRQAGKYSGSALSP